MQDNIKLNDYEIEHNKFLRENGAECTLFLKRNDDFPLDGPCDVALYGCGARKTIKGGTGSGDVNSRYFVTVEDGLIDAGFNITTTDWLNKYDEVRNEAYKEFVKNVKADARKHHVLGVVEGMGKIMKEPAYAIPLYGAGNVGIYVLSRISGEGSDRTFEPGDYKLTPTEIRDILAANIKYYKFLLVINAGGPVDLSPVIDSVDNVLVLSQLGVETGNILADIVLGKSNPSGKLATTWTKASLTSPLSSFGDKNDTYYNEGIYVGYRLFDKVAEEPAFPFGFGLSYSDFDISYVDSFIDGTSVTVSVNVSNSGKITGKEVVQIYLSAPSVNLDKPYQDLVGFAKTCPINPGENTTLSISFDMKDSASYDTKNSRWILEAGEYIVRVGNSSGNTEPAFVIELSRDVTTIQARKCIGEPEFCDAVSGEWDALSELNESGESGDNISEEALLDIPRYEIKPEAFITQIVEYDKEEEIIPAIECLTDEQLVSFNVGEYSKGITVSGMIGESSTHVAGAAGETTNILEDKGYPVLVMADGPAGLRLSKNYYVDQNGHAHSLTDGLPASVTDFLPKYLVLLLNLISTKSEPQGEIFEQYTTAIPIGTAIAQSFNIDFAYKCGDIIGDEMDRFNVDIWLAPALNIHRSVLCGRNFEYYSEDPVISGKFAAAITNGVQSHKGRAVCIKHYAANNQETNRYNSNSHVSERAMREIYLKGFGICVRESQPLTVMTSYNLLNGVHTSERRDLIEDILRAEFGFNGVVMTDWVVNGGTFDKTSIYPAPVPYKVALAGNDLFMPGSKKDCMNLLKALHEGLISLEQLQINASRVYKLAISMKKN